MMPYNWAQAVLISKCFIFILAVLFPGTQASDHGVRLTSTGGWGWWRLVQRHRFPSPAKVTFPFADGNGPRCQSIANDTDLFRKPAILIRYPLALDFQALDDCSFDVQGSGSTETTVVWVTQQLALAPEFAGHVIVNARQQRVRPEPYISKSGVVFLGMDDIIRLEHVTHVIDVRNALPRLNDGALHVLWLHDSYADLRGGENNFSAYDKIVTVSQTQRNEWSAHPDSAKFVAIPNGVRIDGLQPNLTASKSFQIIATSAKTNVDKFASIVQSLRKQDHRFHGVLISPIYRGLAMKEGLQVNGTKYLGHLPHKQALALVRDSFAYVYPTDYQESYGAVFVESLALGTPLLTERVLGSGVNELLPPELLLDPGAPIDQYVAVIMQWSKSGRPVVTYKGPSGLDIVKLWVGMLRSLPVHTGAAAVSGPPASKMARLMRSSRS